MTNLNNSKNQGPWSQNSSKILYPKFESFIMPFIDTIEIYSVARTDHYFGCIIIHQENVLEISVIYIRKTKKAN